MYAHSLAQYLSMLSPIAEQTLLKNKSIESEQLFSSHLIVPNTVSCSESVHSQLPLTYVIDNDLDRETEVLEEFIEEEELLVEQERSAGQLIEPEKSN